jgi:hypothetical protein
MRHAQERRHMMLAVALDADVAQHDEIVVAAGLLELARQHLGGIERVARVVFLERIGDAARRILEALACGIVAGPGDQRAHGVLRVGARGPLWGQRPFQGYGGLSGRNVVHGCCRRPRACRSRLALEALKSSPADAICLLGYNAVWDSGGAAVLFAAYSMAGRGGQGNSGPLVNRPVGLRGMA